MEEYIYRNNIKATTMQILTKFKGKWSKDILLKPKWQTFIETNHSLGSEPYIKPHGTNRSPLVQD